MEGQFPNSQVTRGICSRWLAELRALAKRTERFHSSSLSAEPAAIHLLDCALSLDAQVGWNKILINVAVEVYNVGFLSPDKDGRVRRSNHAEVALVDQFHHHFQNAALVRLRQRHFGLIQQQNGSMRQAWEVLAEHR